MYRITLKLRGKEMKKVEGDYRRMTNKGAEKVASNFANGLRMSAQGYGLFWHGNLIESIKVQPEGRTRFNVLMAAYGPKFETDRKIGYVSKDLEAWSYDKIPDLAGRFLAKVRASGHIVEKRPFITDTLNNETPKIPFIMLQNLRMGGR